MFLVLSITTKDRHLRCHPAGPRDLTKEASDISNRIHGDIGSDTSVTSNVIPAIYQEMMEIKSDLKVARHLARMIRVNKNAR